MKLNSTLFPLVILLFTSLFTASLFLHPATADAELPPLAAAWSQDAGNAQRTGYTPEEPLTPWNYLWSWNGPDASGGAGSHFYDAPSEARTIAADDKLFVPAGSHGLYALNLTRGDQLWHVDAAAFNAAPAYGNGYIYAGGSNGNLYKIDGANGQIAGSYNAESPLNKAILIVGASVFAVSDDGRLHKVDSNDMRAAWTYNSGSTIATPPSYSATRDTLIYATDDLYIHAVNNADGTAKWRVKPTPNTPGGTAQATVAGAYLGSQFELAWPVVADQAGVVLLRMQLPHQALYEGPNEGKWDKSSQVNRAWLEQNPRWQNLFALHLDNGDKAFIPVVGYGSTEDFANGEPQGVMGSQPVVKTLPDGKQVAYILFRNGQHDNDYRWSGHMGEMVLDDATVPGLWAGDLRFVNTYGWEKIIDEQNPISMAGNTLFHSHWAAVIGQVIRDRSSSLGLTSAAPITTARLAPIVRAVKACGARDATTHRTSSDCSSLNYVTDGGRYVQGPGWWGYWNVADPPGWRVGSGNSAGTAYSAGFLPRYTYVAEGKIVVEGNGGELLIFSHSSSAPDASPTPAPRPITCAPGMVTPTLEAQCYFSFVPLLQTGPQ
jgi:hypothetical protein